MFVYLSYENQSNNWVYFDDFKVTHTKSNVIQYNEYYPFGMNTANSWTRENTTGNNFLYNAGSELNKTTSNYEMFFREYDPALGRMTSVDPVAGKYSSLTPYNYAFNDPVTYNDPLGDDASDRNYGKFSYFNGSADFSPQDAHAGPGSGGMFGDAWDYETYGGNFEKFGPGNTGFRDSFINERLAIAAIKKAVRILSSTSRNGTKATKTTSRGPRVIQHKKLTARGMLRKRRIINNNDRNDKEQIGNDKEQIRLFYQNIKENGPGKGEDAPDSRFISRGYGTGPIRLFEEFMTGEGPEYSMFEGNHPMIEDLKDSWIVALAQFKRAMSGSEVLIQYDVPFGVVGAAMSKTLTEHFIGGARVTIIPFEGGTYFQVDNTTDQHSFKFHMGESYQRNPDQETPGGPIYQRFIWFIRNDD